MCISLHHRSEEIVVPLLYESERRLIESFGSTDDEGACNGRHVVRYLVGIAGALMAVFAIVVGIYLVGFRTKNAMILRGVRKVNRVVFNPKQMRSAGTPGAYASIVRHRGRTSGTAYETPIVVREYEDDLVVVLPYATGADWIKNVLAAGEATIVFEGNEWFVDRPQLIDTDDVPGLMTANEERTNRIMGITDAVRFRRSAVSTHA